MRLLLLCIVVCHGYVLPKEAASTSEPSPQYEIRNQDVIVAAKEIISSGLQAIKGDIEKIPDDIDNAKPSEEEWIQLNKTLEEFFDKQLNKSGDNSRFHIIETIRNAFEDLSERFLGMIKQKGYKRQVKRPGFISRLFSGGAQNVASNINTLATTTSHIVVNSLGSKQQFQTTTAAPGFFQGAINQFNKVVSNFRPTSTEHTPMETVHNFGNANQVLQSNAQEMISANTNHPMEMLVCYNLAKLMNNFARQK